MSLSTSEEDCRFNTIYFPYVVLLIAMMTVFFHNLCGNDYVVDPSFVYNNDIVPQAIDLTRSNSDKTLQYTRYSLYIPSTHDIDKSLLHVWLYLPQKRTEDNVPTSPEPHPLIIMSHGLGAQKDFGLEPYAISFLQAGCSVLIFDYRHFGGSFSPSKTVSKSIRNLIHPWNHVEDMNDIIQAVHNGVLDKYNTPLAKVDKENIILWGTSFAGGHVLMAASQLPSNHRIRGIISQVPHLNGQEASKRAIHQRGLIGSIKIALISIADWIVSHFLGYSPIYIKIAGNTTETAYMMLTKEELDLYYGKHPILYLGGWKNLAPARTVAMMSFYNPIQVVPKITVPILFIGAVKDALCPIDFVYQAKASSPNADLIDIATYDSSHFEIYQIPEVKEKMIAFIQQHVGKKDEDGVSF